MLTRNFMCLLGGMAGMNLENVPPFKDVEGNTGELINKFDYSFLGNQNWKYAKFAIGSGLTKPKSTDYKLESEITEGYDCSSLIKRYVQGEEKDSISIYGVITNTGLTGLAFSEIGLLGRQAISASNTSQFLFAHEVYDTPITIPPGESVAVNVNTL